MGFKNVPDDKTLSLIGETDQDLTYHEMVKIFGKPNVELSIEESRLITSKWSLLFDGQFHVVIYDYKETSNFHPSLPSVEEFRNKPHSWHIAGFNAVGAFIANKYIDDHYKPDPSAGDGIDMTDITNLRAEYNKYFYGGIEETEAKAFGEEFAGALHKFITQYMADKFHDGVRGSENLKTENINREMAHIGVAAEAVGIHSARLAAAALISSAKGLSGTSSEMSSFVIDGKNVYLKSINAYLAKNISEMLGSMVAKSAVMKALEGLPSSLGGILAKILGSGDIPQGVKDLLAKSGINLSAGIGTINEDGKIQILNEADLPPGVVEAFKQAAVDSDADVTIMTVGPDGKVHKIA